LRSKEPAYGPSEPAPLLAPPPLPLPTPGIQDVKKSTRSRKSTKAKQKSPSRKTMRELTESESGKSIAYFTTKLTTVTFLHLQHHPAANHHWQPDPATATVEVEVKPAGAAVDPQPVAAATHQQPAVRNHLVVAAVEAVPVVKKADQDQVLNAVAEAEVPAVADEPISQPERSQVHSSKSTIYPFIVLSLFPTCSVIILTNTLYISIVQLQISIVVLQISIVQLQISIVVLHISIVVLQISIVVLHISIVILIKFYCCIYLVIVCTM
jgi:hypothetical protein